VGVEVSYCIVCTEQRERLLACLDAVAVERAAVAFPTETLVLDNASTDGSAEAARSHPAADEVVALARRTGKAANDTALLRRARGRLCLLLNEDSELRPGATAALRDALEGRPDAGAAGARLLRPDGVPYPSAWRFPGIRTALAGALFLHRRLTVQSTGERVREVDWAQSAALMVRRAAAEQVGWLDPAYFVYSDEVDLCRRLRDAGWRTLYVPAAECVHHEQLSTGAVPERRIVELARGRERYMRTHHGRAAALAVRLLTAWTYAARALAAHVLAGHDPARYRAHAAAALRPGRGEGLREAAERFNRERARAEAGAPGP